jgi:hypothetical protein
MEQQLKTVCGCSMPPGTRIAEPEYPMLLQEPTWQDNETGVVMHSSVYATDIYIFPLAFIVFTTSILFQGWRCWQYDQGEGRSKNRLYNPQKGPEFSRWLEYFFTSGMQEALVLLGYNIEQQIKKIYKRKLAKKRTQNHPNLSTC